MKTNNKTINKKNKENKKEEFNKQLKKDKKPNKIETFLLVFGIGLLILSIGYTNIILMLISSLSIFLMMAGITIRVSKRKKEYEKKLNE